MSRDDVGVKFLDDLYAVTELFVPRHCVVCGATGCSGGLCRLCHRIVGLELAKPRRVVGMSEKLLVVAAGEYSGVLARCILGYKEHLRTDLLDVLSSALARSISLFEFSGTVVLVPVPSSHRSVGRRGFSPAEELARGAYGKVILPYRRHLVVADSLVRVPHVKKGNAQKQMGRFDRQRQIRGSMRVRRGADFSGVSCVLVDDVVTTGASLLEAKRVLEDAGARVLGAVTVAWVRRQREVD